MTRKPTYHLVNVVFPMACFVLMGCCQFAHEAPLPWRRYRCPGAATAALAPLPLPWHRYRRFGTATAALAPLPLPLPPPPPGLAPLHAQTPCSRHSPDGLRRLATACERLRVPFPPQTTNVEGRLEYMGAVA